MKALLDQYPNADFCYLGDNARAPYGDKPADTILEYAKQATTFLVNKGAGDIVIACNVATTVALNELSQLYPEVNFYGVIDPTVDSVATDDPVRVGVLGTRATVSSGIYEQKLKIVLPKVQVFSVACPLFVPWIEEGFAETPQTDMVVARYLADLKDFQPDLVILGCTHYPFLEESIRGFLGERVKLISSSTEFVKTLPPHLFAGDSGHQEYYFTDPTSHTVDLAQRWLGEGIELQTAKL